MKEPGSSKSNILQLLDIDPERDKVISVTGGGGKTSLIFCLTEELVSLGKKVIVTTTTHMAYEPERPFAEGGRPEEIRQLLEGFGYAVAACMEISELQGSLLSDEKSVKKIKALPDDVLESLPEECDVLLIEADGSKGLPLKVPADWEPVIPKITDLVIGVMGMDSLGSRIRDRVHRPELAAAFLGKAPEDVITAEDMIQIGQSEKGLRKSVGKRKYRVFLNKADMPADKRVAEKIILELGRRQIPAAVGCLKGQCLSIVILAAGNSRRFGGNKLLHLIDGVPMYQMALQRALGVQKKLEGRISQVILVTQYEEIREAAQKAGARAIQNPCPEEGISLSMKLGLRASLETDACLFMVADQPWLKKETLEGLIATYLRSGKGLAAAAQRGEPGNPCIFARKYYPELMALRGDKGGKRVLKNHLEDAAFFEISDEKELTDVDMPL